MKTIFYLITVIVILNMGCKKDDGLSCDDIYNRIWIERTIIESAQTSVNNNELTQSEADIYIKEALERIKKLEAESEDAGC